MYHLTSKLAGRHEEYHSHGFILSEPWPFKMQMTNILGKVFDRNRTYLARFHAISHYCTIHESYKH